MRLLIAFLIIVMVGVTLDGCASSLVDRGQPRTIHIQEKLGEAGNTVQLVYYKSKEITLERVPLDSVRLAVFSPQVVLARSKAGRDAVASLKEFAVMQHRSLSVDYEDLRRLEEQLNAGNKSLEQEFREKLEQYQLKLAAFSANLAKKQQAVIDLYIPRMEVAAGRIAEREHWDLILDNFESDHKEVRNLLPDDVRHLLEQGPPDITTAVIEEFDQLYK